MFVRYVGLLPFETAFNDFATLARTLTLASPAAVLANNGVMVVGDSVLSAFDKLEVLECSAEAVLDAQPIGGHVAMSQAIIDELTAEVRARAPQVSHVTIEVEGLGSLTNPCVEEGN